MITCACRFDNLQILITCMHTLFDNPNTSSDNLLTLTGNLHTLFTNVHALFGILHTGFMSAKHTAKLEKCFTDPEQWGDAIMTSMRT